MLVVDGLQESYQRIFDDFQWKTNTTVRFCDIIILLLSCKGVDKLYSACALQFS